MSITPYKSKFSEMAQANPSSSIANLVSYVDTAEKEFSEYMDDFVPHLVGPIVFNLEELAELSSKNEEAFTMADNIAAQIQRDLEKIQEKFERLRTIVKRIDTSDTNLPIFKQ